jgi:heme/copper-type cytochrome/quinol oxidase subunit 2
MTLAVMTLARAHACAVCTGNASGDEVSGAMSIAILVMLIILMSVLASFTIFFLYLRRMAMNPAPDLPDMDELAAS